MTSPAKAPVRAPATKYPKSVQPPPSTPATSGLFVLKAASGNKKLGKQLIKGRWKGFPMYALTLEERKTCWAGCQNWNICYGDNMPFATRYEHGAALEEAVTEDVALLAQLKSSRNGFLVRLHVLGDFYSVEYVQLWQNLLDRYPALHLYGYTHYRHTHPIGAAVSDLVVNNPDRAAFLRSDQTLEDIMADDPLPTAATVPRGSAPIPGTIACPQQTGRTASCATCGLCMSGWHNISFIDHSRSARVLPVVDAGAA